MYYFLYYTEEKQQFQWEQYCWSPFLAVNQSLELFQWEQCCWSPFLASESKSGVISVGTVLLVSLFSQ